MATTILGLNVEVSDKDTALRETFLLLNPSADAVRRLIGTPSHHHFYDSGSRIATYVLVTIDRMICFMVRDVDVEQANEVEKRLRLDIAARMSLPVFQAVIRDIVGKAVDASWYGNSL
jgi:hypothetical protein